MKKHLIFIILALVAIACEEDIKNVDLKSLSLTPSSIEMTVGESEMLTVAYDPENASDKTVDWTSNAPKVAKVSSDGTVVAIAAGNATITVTSVSTGCSASCKVTVKNKAVESVKISQTSASVRAGETIALEATVLPADAVHDGIVWASSDESVATVEDGLVSGIKPGNAVITVSAGGKSAQCELTVGEMPVDGITLNRSEVAIKVDATVQLTATVTPANATDPSVTWTTSNSGVASVDEAGLVKGVSIGEAVITAKAGEKTAECVITVSAKDVESISLDVTSAEVVKDKTITINATVYPADAAYGIIEWTSSNQSIATVNDGVVTGVKAGEAVITAAAGGKSATCNVTVLPQPVESVSLDKTSVSVGKGEEATLTVIVNPANADYDEVVWSSSDNSVATVNNGKIKGITIGTAVITVTVDGKSATCDVTVTPPVAESIILDITAVEMHKNDKVTIKATVLPEDAGNKEVVWYTSDRSVAEVFEGEVTAKELGTATINACIGDILATCEVTVVATPVESITLNKAMMSLSVDDSEYLEATVSPEDATDKTVTWSSSNTSVAEVDEEGLVTGVGKGTAVIKAECAGFSASCDVTVISTKVESITFDVTSKSLDVLSSFTIHASISPVEAQGKTLKWTSSNTAIASVNSDGVVTSRFPGTATITASADGHSATCTVTVSGTFPDVMDLGLSVKWATVNVDASSPTESGGYYAFGETEEKDVYDFSTYKWCEGSMYTFTKYNNQSDYGVVDNKLTLDLEDDVAHVRMGGSWRMPTNEEWLELVENCEWTWETFNGVQGCVVTSKIEGYTDNWIFLPVGGYKESDYFAGRNEVGCYWSSSVYNLYPFLSWILDFGYPVFPSYESNYRNVGYNIRAVTE